MRRRDSRIFQTFADRLRAAFPASARIFEEMAMGKSVRIASTLYDAYRERFGEHLPPTGTERSQLRDGAKAS